MLSVVLVSNYYHHHQSSFSKAMNEMDNIRFCFIETSPMTEERKKMGENGRKAVEETYNWATQEKELLDLYNNIINK